MKKGFTLVELLAVIVVLGIILAIAIPTVMDIVDGARESAYSGNEKLLVNAARNYIAISSNNAPRNIGETTMILLSELQSNQMIGSIKDLKDSSLDCNGHVVVKKTTSTAYHFTPYLKCQDNYLSDTIVSEGLIMDLPLGNHISGNIYLDRSGFNNNGTNHGTVPVSNRFGEAGEATFFSGVSDYISFGNPNLSSLNSATVSFWRRADDAVRWLLFQGQTTSYYLMATSGTGNFYHSNAGSNLRIYRDGILATSPLVDSSWHHYVVTGVNLSTWTVLNLSNYAGFQYNWYLDDLRVYNRVLTAEEVRHNYEIERYMSR